MTAFADKSRRPVSFSESRPRSPNGAPLVTHHCLIAHRQVRVAARSASSAAVSARATTYLSACLHFLAKRGSFPRNGARQGAPSACPLIVSRSADACSARSAGATAHTTVCLPPPSRVSAPTFNKACFKSCAPVRRTPPGLHRQPLPPVPFGCTALHPSQLSPHAPKACIQALPPHAKRASDLSFASRKPPRQRTRVTPGPVSGPGAHQPVAAKWPRLAPPRLASRGVHQQRHNQGGGSDNVSVHPYEWTGAGVCLL